MNYRRVIVLVVMGVAIIGGSYLATSAARREAATISIGLEDAVPQSGMKSTDELIDFWQRRGTRDPQDYISLTYLGHTYVRRARETGNANGYLDAEDALRQALEANPSYEVAQAYLSAVLLSKHDFPGALEIAEGLYASDPGALQALATIGDAQVELGNYDEAEAAYRRLMESSPTPSVQARMARLAWLKGETEEALSLMQQAADQAVEHGLSGEGAAWYYFQLGDLYFDEGQLDQAEEHFTTALALFDGYRLALSGMAEVRAARGDYEAAIEYNERALSGVRDPGYLSSVGYLYELTGRQADAEEAYAEVEAIINQSEFYQTIYRRELSRFYANADMNLDTALELAMQDMELRQDIHGYDTLAWALYKNGRYDEAAQAIEQAMSLHTRDASMYYHAGMIYVALGDEARGNSLLREALATNPYFDLYQADVARETLAELSAS